MSKRTLLGAAVVMCLLMGVAPADGADTKIGFVAIIDLVDAALCQCIHPDSLAVGDTLTGFYMYDSETADTDPSPREGEYLHAVTPYGIEVHHVRYVFATDPSNVDFRILLDDSVNYGGFNDSYQAWSLNNLPDEFLNQPVEYIRIYLRDNSASALPNDSLPDTAPDLDDWPDTKMIDIFGAQADYRIRATLVWIGLGDPPTGILPRGLTPLWLDQNFPNPFSAETRFAYGVRKGSHVTLRVYDVTGRHVRTLVDREMPGGVSNTVVWDGRDTGGNPVASGVYFYRFRAGGDVLTRKMILLR